MGKQLKEQSLNLLNHYFREMCRESGKNQPACGKIRNGYYTICDLNNNHEKMSKLEYIFKSMQIDFPLSTDPRILFKYTPEECVEFYSLLEEADKMCDQWKIEKHSIWGESWKLTCQIDFIQLAVIVDKDAIYRMHEFVCLFRQGIL